MEVVRRGYVPKDTIEFGPKVTMPPLRIWSS